MSKCLVLKEIHILELSSLLTYSWVDDRIAIALCLYIACQSAGEENAICIVEVIVDVHSKMVYMCSNIAWSVSYIVAWRHFH